MNDDRNPHTDVPAVQNDSGQRPIPTAWRPVFCRIVDAFVRGDHALKAGMPGVAAIQDDTAAQIRDYISDYGATLVALPQDTWESSVCIWCGAHWDVLVDLWTHEEGRSDLVLGARVTETEAGFAFQVQMVYVP